jgi:hypothetical protein
MKGVIVKVGDPKSIVLLNNGKIMAIPTPADCHVGMVITVRYNNILKIIIIAFAAALLVALGIFIGITFFGGNSDVPPDDLMRGRHGHGRMRMMEQCR